MNHKVFRYGTGSGKVAVEYVCSPNPFGRGQRKVPPVVLKGDPNSIVRHTNDISFKWKYSSGVLSFAQSDTPTKQQIEKLIDRYEDLMFAGLPLSSRSILWVMHTHLDRVELHFIVPRQEIHTGKSFNAFPPHWELKYDHIRDAFNFQYGWARPNDPLRARPFQPKNSILIENDAQRKGKTIEKSLGRLVSDNIIEKIYSKDIINRNDIVNEIINMGYELTRQGKDYITVFDKQTNKRERLKGTIFVEDFNADKWLDNEKSRFEKIQDNINKPDLEKAKIADDALLKAIVASAAYNKKRYNIEELNYDNTVKQTRSAGIDIGYQSANRTGKNAIQRKIAGTSASIQNASHSSAGQREEYFCGSEDRRGIPEANSHGQSRNSIDPNSAKYDTVARKPDDTISRFFHMGAGSGEGSTVENVDRGGITQSLGSADGNFTGSGGQVDGAVNRQGTGGYDELTDGHFERVARTPLEIGELSTQQSNCAELVKRIDDSLEIAHDFLQIQRIVAATPVFNSPPLAPLATVAGNINAALPIVNNLICLKKFSTQNKTFFVASALDTDNALEITHDFLQIQRIVAATPVFNSPPLATLADVARNIGEALPIVSNLICLKKFSIQNKTLFVASALDTFESTSHNIIYNIDFVPLCICIQSLGAVNIYASHI